ncbi:MAG TPA: VWA domain-containing protein, partial [Polyangiales bacterium]|nr:VWA domain-containing protein [Polyangiales bacterium]
MTLTRIEGATQRPSNIALFFGVDRRAEPVADLLATDFTIYEDGRLVSIDESRQTIINPEVAAAHYTLVLVDMSASVTASAQLPLIASAATQFVGDVGTQQRVAVYAFDGGPNIYEISPFQASEVRATQSLHALQSFRARDPSTNLNGAVLQGLARLDDAIAASSVPLRFGSLVVFTDGTDRADRVPLQAMLDAVASSPYDVYAIGVGHEIDDRTLSAIGKSGKIRVEDLSASATAFDEIGDRILRAGRRYYLLSYCTPARAGLHRVTVEAHYDGADGIVEYDFDATGFGPGCDPNRAAPFDTTGRNRTIRARMEGREVLRPNAPRAAAPAPVRRAPIRESAGGEAVRSNVSDETVRKN